MAEQSSYLRELECLGIYVYLSVSARTVTVEQKFCCSISSTLYPLVKSSYAFSISIMYD